MKIRIWTIVWKIVWTILIMPNASCTFNSEYYMVSEWALAHFTKCIYVYVNIYIAETNSSLEFSLASSVFHSTVLFRYAFNVIASSSASFHLKCLNMYTYFTSAHYKNVQFAMSYCTRSRCNSFGIRWYLLFILVLKCNIAFGEYVRRVINVSSPLHMNQSFLFCQYANTPFSKQINLYWNKITILRNLYVDHFI